MYQETYQILRKNIRQILIIVALSGLFVACGKYYQRVSDRNFAHIYNPMLTEIHPLTMLHRVAADSSVLFIRIPVNDIAFPEFRRRQDHIAGVQIEYYLLDSAGAKMYRDSGSVRIHKPQKPATNFMQFTIGISHHPDSTRLIEIRIEDLLSGAVTADIIRLLEDSRNNRQRYSAYFNNNQYPLIRHFASPGDSIQIDYTLPSDSLWVFHLTYNRNDTLPYDTVYKTGATEYFRFQQTGSYIMNADSTLNGGMRYLCTDQHFPSVTESAQMLKPIRYLTNKKEWKKLTRIKPKSAVDTFWLVAAPDTETARQLIQVFYNRIQLANIKFSNHREGWKTAPGKTLVLTGLPNEVEFTDTGQNWYYFIRKNEKLRIPFVYNQNSDEYILQRNDSIINQFFYHYINQWRKGKY